MWLFKTHKNQQFTQRFLCLITRVPGPRAKRGTGVPEDSSGWKECALQEYTTQSHDTNNVPLLSPPPESHETPCLSKFISLRLIFSPAVSTSSFSLFPIIGLTKDAVIATGHATLTRDCFLCSSSVDNTNSVRGRLLTEVRNDSEPNMKLKWHDTQLNQEVKEWWAGKWWWHLYSHKESQTRMSLLSYVLTVNNLFWQIILTFYSLRATNSILTSVARFSYNKLNLTPAGPCFNWTYKSLKIEDCTQVLLSHNSQLWKKNKQLKLTITSCASHEDVETHTALIPYSNWFSPVREWRCRKYTNSSTAFL